MRRFFEINTRSSDGQYKQCEAENCWHNMKRLLFFICSAITLSLVLLIVFHKKTQDDSSQYLQKQLATATDYLSQIKTSPVTLDGFDQALLERTGTNLNFLSTSERSKLFDCLNRFYSCYSSGNFDDYKQFRLSPPFTVSKGIVSFVKENCSSSGAELISDEDILRTAWNFFNDTNKISQIDTEDIRLSVVTKSDLGLELRQASDSSKWPEIATATCLEGTILYQPTLSEILKNKGSVRYFVMEVKVRFNSVADGPAIPLLLVGYWDSTRGNWIPHCLCFWIGVSQYRTFF